MEDLIQNNQILIQDKKQYVDRFLNYIDVSEKTAKEYKAGLKMFFQFIGNNTQITRQDVIDFRDNLISKGKSTNTINLYLISVKSFFKWLEYENVCKDITKNIKALPVERVHTKEPFSVDEVKFMLENCSSLKEQIIIRLGFTCGLRCNEMCNIRIQDFQIKQGTICLYVLGKARKNTRTDFVIVDNRTFESIKEYVAENNIQDYLFVSTSNNNKGNPISTNAMRDIVNKIFDRCGLKDEKHVFHSLRHGFASTSIQNGNDIRAVSQALRHKNIQTSMIYLHDLELINNKCTNTIANMIA